MKGNDPLAEAVASEADVERLRALAREFNMAFLEAVSRDMLDPLLLGNVPVEWARTNCLLPVRIDGNLSVLTADPRRIHEQEYLSLLIGHELRPVLASRATILSGIEQCYYRKTATPSTFLKDLAVPGVEVDEPQARADDLLQVAERAPVTQLVNLILLEAVKQGASDIHFEPYESRLRVRYRIDGILYEQASPPKHLEEALVSRLKVMAHLDIAEKRLPQDGMARVRVGTREIDVRMSSVPVAEGERVVLRLLDLSSALLPLGVLGMPDAALAMFESLLAEPSGIIIVCGPTGSGKTTTLYAALGRLDSCRRNILTIEDPIEYQLPNIGQIQVKPKIGLTFSSGLRHILRQDPDVILVGETRDLETAEIAMRAALTGHLVFTTLHTNDAPGAVIRLLDMGVESYLLASCLRAALAQRLVRKLCPECRRPSVVSPTDVRGVAGGETLLGKTMWTARGCPVCLEGYRGRLGLFELMVADRGIQNAIRDGRGGAAGLRGEAEKAGMSNLLADGLSKVLAGVTSLSEVVAVAR
jgi:general secretion pathway protein E